MRAKSDPPALVGDQGANEDYVGGAVLDPIVPQDSWNCSDATRRDVWLDGYVWGYVHGAREHTATQQQLMDGIAGRYFRLIHLHDELERETHPVLQRPSLEELRKARANNTVRPVPTPLQCAQSWLPSLVDHARRNGASQQQITDLVVRELAPHRSAERGAA